MQIVSDAVKQLLDNFSKVTLSVYVGGEKLEADVDSCSHTGACAGDSEFSFGNACAAGVSISLGARVIVPKESRIKITWSVDDAEYPLITGKVKRAKVTAGRTEVEAWDDMYYAGSDAFHITEAVSADCDADVAFAAVAASMGVSAEPETLKMLSGLALPGGLSSVGSDVSNSAVVGYIAGLVGGNALMTRAGLLAIRQYTETGWETEPYSGGASAENEDFSVTGVTLQREKAVNTVNDTGATYEQMQTEEFVAGDGALMFSNPLASQEAADRAYAALQMVSIRPGDYSFPGGLLLEPGDIFTVHSMDGSYSVAVATITTDYDGGVKSSVACGGAAEDEGATGTINQALKAFLADYAKFKKMEAENAVVTNAYIKNLFAGSIEMTGSFMSTAETYLPPTYDDVIYTLRAVLFPDKYPLPAAYDFDLNGDGVFDKDDALTAMKVYMGEIAMKDCAGAAKTPVTICINMSDPEKLIHIYGKNMWGSYVETFISADVNNCSFASREYLQRMMNQDPDSSIVYRTVNDEKEYFNPPMVVGEIYRTVERYQGQPVYTTALDFGSLPNNSAKILSIDDLGATGIIYASGMTSNGRFFPCNTSTIANGIDLYALPTSVTIKTNADLSGQTAVVTIKYIKS